MKNKKSILSVAVTAGIVMTAAARAEAPPIVVGFAIAQTGWMAPNDTPSEAAELAIQDINAKGGLLGRKIVTVYADTKSDRVEGTKAGLAVLAKGADLVVVTCDYDMGGPAALAAVKAGKMAWSLCAEEVKFGRLGPNVFTIGPAAQVIGASIAEWGYKQKGYRNLFVLLDDSLEYTKEVCFGMTTAWSRLPGARIVGSDNFKNGDASIATQITRIKNTSPKPDAIALCTYPPGGVTAVRQLYASGATLPVLANDAMDGAFWMNAVPNLKNFYVPAVGSVYGDDPRPEINAVLKRLIAKDGHPPAFGYAFTGYSDIQLWAKAVERAKSLDAKLVTAQLEKFRDEPSLMGPVSFSKGMHVTAKYTFQIIGVENGKRKRVGSSTPTTVFTQKMLFGVQK
jgi:branched-chain amino acid transport system substrate-binding protein